MCKVSEEPVSRENTVQFVAEKLVPSSGQVTVEAFSAARRPLVSIENSLNRDYGLDQNDINRDDAVSLQVSETERRNSGFYEDSEARSVSYSKNQENDDNVCDFRFSKYMSVCEDNRNKSLLNVFGEDAQTKSQKSSFGIILDEAQKTVISESFRSEKPDKLSCFKDSYRNDFPVRESCENWFNVPKLDDTVESLLI